VGIEIPNSKKTIVGLASLLSDKTYAESANPLLFTLGRAVTGTPKFSDLGRAPHMLIAGATGSGKSVTIHALLTSLLYRNSPENLQFILIDPKRVELTLYNNIPHLATPVITNPKKAVLALKWAIKDKFKIEKVGFNRSFIPIVKIPLPFKNKLFGEIVIVKLKKIK